MNESRELMRAPQPGIFGYSSGRWALGALVLLLILIEADQVRRLGDFRVDDAYITFSYSKNLALLKGPVYSHALRVEGYSNFLWMVLVALGYPFGVDPYVTSRVLSFLAIGLCFSFVYRVVRPRAGFFAAATSLVFLACCTDLTVAALSGLETAAFTASVAFGWSVYLRERPSERKWSLWAFLPAALFRIDGFVHAFLVGGVELISSLLGRRFRFRRYLLWSVPPLLLWLLYFAARFSYYGLPLPTTYYAKEVVTQGDPNRGLHQLQALWSEYGLTNIVWIPFVPLLTRLRALSAQLALGLLGAWGYAAYVGGDWMPFYRFLLPGMPLVAMLLGLGLGSLTPSSWSLASLRPPVLKVSRISALILALFCIGRSLKREHMASLESGNERAKVEHLRHVQRHTSGLIAGMDLAQYIVRHPGERLATDYAGVFAVFTEANIIDMWGLANRDIALFGGTEGVVPIYGKECIGCLPALDPEYFHDNMPLVTTETRYRSQRELIGRVFLGHEIDSVLGLKENFVAGLVLEEATGRALWFLEKRKPGRLIEERQVAEGILVKYPFETGAYSQGAARIGYPRTNN